MKDKKRDRGKVVYVELVDPIIYQKLKDKINEKNKKITKELGAILNRAMEEEIERYEDDNLEIRLPKSREKLWK